MSPVTHLDWDTQKLMQNKKKLVSITAATLRLVPLCYNRIMQLPTILLLSCIYFALPRGILASENGEKISSIRGQSWEGTGGIHS